MGEESELCFSQMGEQKFVLSKWLSEWEFVLAKWEGGVLFWAGGGYRAVERTLRAGCQHQFRAPLNKDLVKSEKFEKGRNFFFGKNRLRRQQKHLPTQRSEGGNLFFWRSMSTKS